VLVLRKRLTIANREARDLLDLGVELRLRSYELSRALRLDGDLDALDRERFDQVLDGAATALLLLQRLVLDAVLADQVVDADDFLGH